MGLYEHLPYANFHELNLDKVMDIVANIPSLIYNEVLKALKTFQIPDGSISSSKLANNAVTSAKIAGLAVLTSKINNNAVTSAKIASGAVTEDKIASGSVTTSKIADEAVDFDKLASGFGALLSGTSPGNVSVASGIGTTYTQIADLEITESGTYILLPWVMVYGTANVAEGFIDANISGTSGHTTGYGYGARWVCNTPAYTAATPTSFTWHFVRNLTAGSHVYLNAAHNTGAARNIRGGIRAIRIK